jgi:hypothetical protein
MNESNTICGCQAACAQGCNCGCQAAPTGPQAEASGCSCRESCACNPCRCLEDNQ